MTRDEFRAAQDKLDLSDTELGNILNTDTRTIRRWKAKNDVTSARDPNPVAARVMEWMLDGYRPPQWPEGK